jgi:hypothetical protein
VPPEAVPFRTLSKSDFKAARTCPTKLYYRELRYPTTDDRDEYLAMLSQGGYMVEAIAKLRYPEGIALEYGRDAVADAAITAEHLRQDRVTLFEATLLSGQKQARVDILEKRGNAFRLVEVKAKSFDSAEHAALLLDGKKGVFRSGRRPHRVTSEWDEYVADIAFQLLTLRELYPSAMIKPFLCLVDKAKATSIDGLPAWFRVERRVNRAGIETVHRVHVIGDVDRMRADDILTEVDVSDEIDSIMEEVREQVGAFEASLAGGLRKIGSPIGVACKQCEYRFDEPVEQHGFAECWGELAHVNPSVLDLYHSDDKIVSRAIRDRRVALVDVPEDLLARNDGSIGAVASRQLVQLRHTRSNTIWCGAGLRPALEAAMYPLHFIDFEAARLAIPPHAGMRPYGLLAFQWSCHTIASPGAPLTHAGWLNTEDMWPNAEFARSLRERIGRTGTVLAWAHFEGSTLKEVLRELDRFGAHDPRLADWITWITEKGRILDLNQLALGQFFHPDMRGRTSIKVVLDALWKSDPVMRARFRELTGREGDPLLGPYSALPPVEINGTPQQVVEGTGAIRAYEAMMYGVERDDAETKARWSRLLDQYCALDTLAMVLIWEYWQRAVG